MHSSIHRTSNTSKGSIRYPEHIRIFDSIFNTNRLHVPTAGLKRFSGKNLQKSPPRVPRGYAALSTQLVICRKVRYYANIHPILDTASTKITTRLHIHMTVSNRFAGKPVKGLHHERRKNIQRYPPRHLGAGARRFAIPRSGRRRWVHAVLPRDTGGVDAPRCFPVDVP